MLESVFIILVAIAFILFILGVEEESKMYCIMSGVLWLIVFVQSLWIEVPSDEVYTEYTLNVISLIFIFANIIYYLALQFDWRRNMP